MAEIDRLNHLLAEVRASLVSRSRRTEGGAASAGAASASRTSGSASTADLREALVKSLRALGPITADNRQLARKQFVQWALLGEFGFDLANDPDFVTLCDKVLQTIVDDADLSTRLDGFLTTLA